MARAPMQPAVAQVAPGPRSAGVSWRLRSPLLPWLALAALIAFGTIQTAVRFHNYHLGLLGDDYDFLLAREGLSLHNLLQPHNENLSTVGVLLYRGIFAVVGLSTAVPYIGLLLLSLAACAALSYVFVRRELGSWVALIVPLLLVTLGPAAEALLWPFEVTLFSALAFWLGAMLLIERAQPRTDAIGCGLLILGIGSQSLAVALLPATALALVLWTGWRNALRRAWIVALPLVLYLAWYVAYAPQLERHLARVPGFVVNSFVAAVVDISGVSGTSLGVPLAVVLIVAVCARCVYMRRVPATTLYMGLGVVTVWIAAGLSEGPGRVPSQSRYQFHNSLLLMLALAPLVARLRWTPVRGGLLVLLVGAIVISNLGGYGHWENVFNYQESVASAELSALELARPAVVDPRAPFTTMNEAGLYWPFAPKAYFNAIDAHGSPVRVDRDLERASPAARAQADVVIVRVEALTVVSGDRSGTVRPRGVSGVPLQAGGAGCAVVPEGAASAGIQVMEPRGGLIIRPDAGPPVGVGAARFSDPPAAVPLVSVPGASQTAIRTEQDASSTPWRFQLTAPQAVTVCSLAE